MASSETFTLKTYSFKNDNATQSTTATLQIHITHKSQVHVQTYNDDDVGLLPLITSIHEVMVSPMVTSNRFAMPPHVIALSSLRRGCILKALASVSIIDGSLCECLAPSIEKYVVQEAEGFGYKGFGVVAELEVTRVYGYKHEAAATTQSNLLRRRRIATKVDVYDLDQKTCSMMAASDDHPKKIV